MKRSLLLVPLLAVALFLVVGRDEDPAREVGTAVGRPVTPPTEFPEPPEPSPPPPPPAEPPPVAPFLDLAPDGLVPGVPMDPYSGLARPPEEPRPSAEPVELEGRVVDDLGAPVTRFRIRADPRGQEFEDEVTRTVEDASGAFRLELASGRWELVASLEDERFHSVPVEVLLYPAAPNTVELVLPRSLFVEGLVVDESGLGVAAKIHVGVTSPSATSVDADFALLGSSAPDGSFRLPATAGALHLYATADGYARSEIVKVPTQAGVDCTGVLLTLRAGGTLRVELLDAGGRPLAGHTVELSSWPYVARLRTDDTGSALFEHVPAGELYVDATTRSRGPSLVTGTGFPFDVDNGYSDSVSDWIELEDREYREVILRGPETREVEVTLRFSTPGSLQLSHVTLREAPWGRSREALRQADGSYSVTVPAPGAYFVDVHSYESGLSWRKQADVPDAPRTSLELTLEAGWISGTVRDEQGRPVVGVEVVARKGRDPVRESATTDSGGRYEHRVPVGTLEVYVEPPGLAPLRVAGIAVGPRERVDGVDLDLVQAGSLRGTVVDPTGAPVSGAWVGIDAPRTCGVESDPEGRFEMVGLPPGKWSVYAGTDELASPGPEEVEIVSGATAEVLLPTVPVRGLTVVVRDPSGRAIEADDVLLVEPFEGSLSFIPIRKRYEAGGLPYGSYLVRAIWGERTVELAFVVTGGAGPLELELAFD